MPLYEYECDACGKRLERIQKFSDPPLAVCPSCGGSLRKLVSSPAFQFKGTGWYVTDYARKSDGSKSGGNSASKDKENKEKDKDSKSAETTESSKPSSADASSTSTSSTPPAAPTTPTKSS